MKNILRGQIDLKAICENYDDVLCIANSICESKVSGELIMGKLGSHAHRVAMTFKEMGRIKTKVYILDYTKSETVRRRIQ